MIGIIDFVNQRVQPGDKILDLGCGNCKVSRTLQNVTTVDIWPKANPDHLIDLSTEGLPASWGGVFDIVLMLDLIEHLDKGRGLIILEDAKRVCKRELILLTPLRWDENIVKDKQSWYYGNPYNIHKSLWSKKDFLSTNGWRRYPVEKNYYYVGVWKCLK